MTSALGTAAIAWISLQCLAAVLRYIFNFDHISLGWLSVSAHTQALNRQSCYPLGGNFNPASNKILKDHFTDPKKAFFGMPLSEGIKPVVK